MALERAPVCLDRWKLRSMEWRWRKTFLATLRMELWATLANTAFLSSLQRAAPVLARPSREKMVLQLNPQTKLNNSPTLQIALHHWGNQNYRYLTQLGSFYSFTLSQTIISVLNLVHDIYLLTLLILCFHWKNVKNVSFLDTIIIIHVLCSDRETGNYGLKALIGLWKCVGLKNKLKVCMFLTHMAEEVKVLLF